MALTRSEKEIKRIANKTSSVDMNIDDLMRHSYKPESFQFDEKHWEGAKVLLDQKFAQRAFYKKVFIGSVLLLTIGLVALFIFPAFQAKLTDKEVLNTFIVHENRLSENDADSYSNENETIISSNVEGLISQSKQQLKSENSQSEDSQSFNADSGSSAMAVYQQEGEKYSQLFGTEADDISQSALNADMQYLNDSEVIEDNTALTEVQQIPTVDLALIAYNENSIEVGQWLDEDIDDRFYPEKQKENYFLATAIRFYPSESGRPNDFVGLSFGGVYQRFMTNTLFLETGINLSIRSGNFSPSMASTQLSFDFDSRENAYVFRPSSVFIAEVPLMIGFETGKHQLSAGLLPAVLLGVFGDMEFREDLHPWEVDGTGYESNYKSLERGWMDDQTFNRLSFSYSLRYMVTLGRNVQVGFSAQYRPSDWIGNNYGQYFDFNQMAYTNDIIDPKLIRNWILGFDCRFRLK